MMGIGLMIKLVVKVIHLDIFLGVYYYSNGDKYEGNFEDGQRNETGINLK